MKRESGFTLVEIIMVIILLGVLGILGTVGLNSAVSSDSGMYERQLESAIRYAQNYAMSHFTYATVVFSAPGLNPSCTLGTSSSSYSGYAVCACNATTAKIEPLINPLSQTAGNFYVTMSYGISYSVHSVQRLKTNYIAFNSAGQPGMLSPANTNLSCSNSTFTLLTKIQAISFGSLPSQSFYIYPNTGLVSYNGSL